MKKSMYIVLMVLMCAAAAALFLYTTPNGLGLTNDSSAYIGGARSLLAGRGYTRVGGDGLPRAITHFPPFYSIVLAGVSKITGKDALEAAKIVSFCCVILTQALFMTALLVLTGSRRAMALQTLELSWGDWEEFRAFLSLRIDEMVDLRKTT